MHRFARIFFHVRTGNIDGFQGLAHHNFQLAMLDNRQIQLADLIAFGQIGIKVVFAVEHVFAVDGGAQRQAQLNRLVNHFAVHHRQHPR